MIFDWFLYIVALWTLQLMSLRKTLFESFGIHDRVRKKKPGTVYTFIRMGFKRHQKVTYANDTRHPSQSISDMTSLGLARARSTCHLYCREYAWRWWVFSIPPETIKNLKGKKRHFLGWYSIVLCLVDKIVMQMFMTHDDKLDAHVWALGTFIRNSIAQMKMSKAAVRRIGIGSSSIVL